MLRGLYSAASGMVTQQRKHDTASVNMANQHTPGFKEGVTVSRSFPEMMLALASANEPGGSTQIGPLHTGVMAEETMYPVLQGDLRETGKWTDFAITSHIQVLQNIGGEQVAVPFDASGTYIDADGETMYQPQAFFTVLTDQDDLLFTRNGQFTVNEAGELLTLNGHRVLGRGEEPIVLEIDEAHVRVNERGELVHLATGQAVMDASGEPIALLISEVDNPYDLIREGNGLLRLEDRELNSRPLSDPSGVRISQGYVEQSNVDSIRTMTNMMTALRAYESNLKVVQFYDQTLDQAVNEVGRIN